MEKLDEVALFNIAVHLNLSELSALCKANKRFNNIICSRNHIWNYLLNDKFKKEKDDFRDLFEINNPDLFKTSPKNLFKLLYSLDILKRKLNLKDSLLELYKRKEFYLCGKNLEEIPKEIGFLANLRSLILGRNRLKEIPKEMGNLTGLECLWLDDNQLKKIPKEIANLTNLERLSLQNNKLKEIPKEIGNLTNLQMLFLHNNKLKEIPREIGNLTNLQMLFLHNNKLKEIPREIGNIKGLKELYLYDNRLKKIPKEIKDIINKRYKVIKNKN